MDQDKAEGQELMPEVASDSDNATPQTTVPPAVREILDRRDPDSDKLMSFVRSQEAEKHREKIKLLEDSKSQLEQELSEAKKKIRRSEAADTDKLLDRISTMEETVSYIKDSISAVAEAVSKTDINSVKYQVLSQIPENVLPAEFHYMVTGTTREEIKTSLDSAIAAWNSAKSRVAQYTNAYQEQAPAMPLPQQQNPMPVAETPQMLQSPQSGTVENGGSAVPSPSTIQELTRQALNGNSEDLARFEQAASQVISHELGRK
jgi:hypothetical protein